MMSSKTIVLLVFAIGLASASSIAPDLKELCGRGKLSLKSVDDLAALATQAESNNAGCPPIVIEALMAMKKITDEKRACTMEKAVAITTFVDNYLKETSYAIPKALAKFALAYGEKVSNICTGQMVGEFVSVTQARIYGSMSANIYDAFVDFKMFLLEQNPIGTLVNAVAKTGEVILPVDLAQVLPDEQAKFLVQIPQSGLYKNFVSMCQRILQPLYEPMLLPIAHLVRNGFITRPTVKDKRQKQDSRFWATALFFCESLKLMKVEESNTPELTAISAEAGEALSCLNGNVLPSADDEDDEENDARPAPEAQDEQTGQAEGVAEGRSRLPPVEVSALKAPVEPFRSEAEVDGVIVTSRVKPFDTSKSSADRLSERISSRSFRVMQALAQNSNTRGLLKSSLKLVKLQGGLNAAEFEKNKEKFAEIIEKPELFGCEANGGSCPGGKCVAKSNCKISKSLVKKDNNEFEDRRGCGECCATTCECLFVGAALTFGILLGVIRAFTFVLLIIWGLANVIPRFICLGACCLCGQCQRGSCLDILFKSIDGVVATLLLWPELAKYG